MSPHGVTTQAGRASNDARASGNVRDITIGPDILELLTSAMYVDPITIYREYMQNAADAVDEARKGGILAPEQPGLVEISIDSQNRTMDVVFQLRLSADVCLRLAGVKSEAQRHEDSAG